MIRRIALGLVTAVAIPVAVSRAARWVRNATYERLRRTRVDDAISESNAKLEAGSADEALALLIDAFDPVRDADDRLITAMARLLSARGAYRALAALRIIAADLDAALALENRAPREAALAFVRRGAHRDAAKRFEALGELVHAALSFERAGDLARALELWTLLAVDPRVTVDPYLGALCRTKRGRALRVVGDDDLGLAELRRAIELARSVTADGSLHPFGRGFDAASLIIRVAEEIGDRSAYRDAFEWCLADLDGNRLDGYTLQHRIAFARRLRETGDAIAAAQVLARGVEVATSTGAPWEAALAHEAASAYADVARAAYEKGAFEDARTAWEEASRRFAAHNEFVPAAAALEDLASIPTLEPEFRADAIARAAAWRARTDWRGAEALPAFASTAVQFPTVEDEDLLAMENGGDATRVCGDLLVADSQPVYVRHRAGLGLIEALVSAADARSATSERLADALSRNQTFPMLDVFARMLREGDAPSRAHTAKAMRTLCFARTIDLLDGVLDDPDDAVRNAARTALRDLHFPHALLPLRRILERSTDVSTRTAILANLGRMQSDAAIDTLVEFATRGEADLRSLATSQLVSHPYAGASRRIRRAFASVETRVLAAETQSDRSATLAEGEVLNEILRARQAARDEDDNVTGLWGLRMRRRVRSIRERRDG